MPKAVTAASDPERRTFPASLRLVGGVVAVAIAAVTAGPYVLDTYTVNILVRSFVYAATALTVDILWGYAGILTFGQAAFFGIGAYAAGMIFSYMDFSPETALLALLAGIGASAVIAAITGWVSFFHGASPLYVAIVTLALPIILVQVLYSGGTFTGSSSGLVGYNTFDLPVEAWFTITGISLVLLTAAAWLFVRSDFGRVLVAIRENEQRCTYLGINAPRVKTLLMVVVAMIASVAGYAYAGYTVVVAPEIGSFVFGTELVMWVALGGRGTLIGPVLGTVAIDLTTAYLSGNMPFVWKLVVGSVFVLVIVALPQGLLPVLTRGGKRLWGAIARLRASETLAAPVLADATASRRPGVGSDAPALLVSKLRRSYGSLKVLEDVSFEARGSELLGIIGPNGAGKTTLMRCLSDGYERSGGSVAVFGSDIARYPPHSVVGLGIGRSFQTTSLFETLTIAECLRLARFRLNSARHWSRASMLPLPESARRVIVTTGLDGQMATQARYLAHGMKRALELAQDLTVEENLRLGLRDDKSLAQGIARVSEYFPIIRERFRQKAGTLSGGEQRMLIVSRALLVSPHLMLIDEITEGLQPTIIERLARVLKAERERTGAAIFVVEQNVPFALSVSDRYALLKIGEITDEGVTGSESAAMRIQDQLRV